MAGSERGRSCGEAAGATLGMGLQGLVPAAPAVCASSPVLLHPQVWSDSSFKAGGEGKGRGEALQGRVTNSSRFVGTKHSGAWIGGLE